jgi:hypothetical protein
LKLVRWSKFSKSDLFWNTYDTDNRYKKYFEKFKNSLVEIDDWAEYTFIEWNKLKFRLDNSGWDEEYNIDKELPLDKITDTNWKLDKDKLKKELALMVSDIIDKNLS